VYTTTIAGVGPVTVDPPVILTPRISVQPVSVNVPVSQVVTPVIDVPPNIKLPVIPIPIPPGWVPNCLIFRGLIDILWPTIMSAGWHSLHSPDLETMKPFSCDLVTTLISP